MKKMRILPIQNKTVSFEYAVDKLWVYDEKKNIIFTYCKSQYKNVGKMEYKNVGFSTYSSAV